MPRSLEILLVPGVLVAAAVHAPIGAPAGLPVPLGFLSFGESVLRRAEAFIAERLGAFRMEDALYDDLHAALARSTSAGDDATGVPASLGETETD